MTTKKTPKKISKRKKWPVAQVYKTTYSNGKTYIGCRPYLAFYHFGKPNRVQINEDFLQLPKKQRDDLTVRKQILWEKEHGTDQEVRAMRNELIVKHQSNNPEIGYNRIPRYKPSGDRVGIQTMTETKKPKKKISDRDRWPIAQIYKITYPNGKIYVGSQPYLSYRYFGSPNRALINEDFLKMPEEVRKDYTCRKQILWEKENATESEMYAMENKLIVEHQSNNPEIGYNRRPKFRASEEA